MPNLNFFDNYALTAVTQEIVPAATFFRNRYFPTGAGDIFASDKVLTEYRKGDRNMACFVAPRIGDIPIARDGYTISEFTPPYIAPSRLLTIDDLKKRGFGEAIYPGSTPAERAAKLQLEDLTDLDRRIQRREEWMAVQTMLSNACTIQEYIDAETEGETKMVFFYDPADQYAHNDHTYTITTKWDASGADIRGDVRNMCMLLSKRGLPAADLVLGTKAADALLNDEFIAKQLSTQGISGYKLGGIDETIQYPGVVLMGVLNFGGFRLNVFCVSESYVDDNGTDTPYFPEKGAMVTAPGCGHMMYGAITQIDYGATDFATYAAARVPKFVLDQDKDVRKLRLAARPLAAPKTYCPYIYAENAVS